MAKVKINLDQCVACGRCVETCPVIFENDMATLKVKLKGGERDGSVWSLEIQDPSCACEAAEGCVMKAISVE